MSKFNELAAGLVLATTAAIGGAGVALADGYAPPKVAYERPMDWSGVYFGIGSGYQWSSIDVARADRQLVDFPRFGFTSDHDETFVSAHVGYQLQWRTFVLGVEGGWMSTLRDRDGSFEACFNHPGVPPVPPTGVLVPGVPLSAHCTARLQDIFTIGGRVGYPVGKWMPYVTGGYANGAFDFDARTAAPGFAGAGQASILQEQAHDRLDGWYIGGGLEWVISPGWTTGIEYRHYEFDGKNATAFSGCALGGVGTTPVTTPGCASSAIGLPLEKVRLEASTDSVEARVSWRWGREPTAAPPLK
jgi:opacity protein-like surface antigen